ncbi:MAG: septum formation protein Maf [Clostridia bacterium]|nr:septum formation protein Maf [Clostridia bacterium]MBQ9924458.1 septum formation protein Maf [Clostridia bacterium]
MIILASQSPRRREILEKLIPDFIVCPSDADEQIDEADPRAYAMELAVRKAQDVAAGHAGDTVIAADTIVCLSDRILGKPGNAQEARDYLCALSGEVHEVYTGVAVVHNGQLHRFCECTEVHFRHLTDGLIEGYIASGEPMDKAGAYGIQGIGGRFVEGIHGDFFNVMGLPLCALSCLLEELGIVGGTQA